MNLGRTNIQRNYLKEESCSPFGPFPPFLTHMQNALYNPEQLSGLWQNNQLSLENLFFIQAFYVFHVSKTKIQSEMNLSISSSMN